MTIKIYSDRIDIGDYTLFEGNGGVQFDGVARAENFKGGAGTFQGSVSGYTCGGFGSPPGARNIIDKFPFATDTNATDVGDLIGIIEQTAGQSSATHGYVSGGRDNVTLFNTIQKFLFAVDTNATDVGDLAATLYTSSGQSSATYGYASGGLVVFPGSVGVNNINKFPFAVDTNASDVGDLTQARNGSAGQSSTTHGYQSGGNPGVLNTIDRFPFSADSNATDVGDLTQARVGPRGQSSTTHGFTSGGVVPPTPPYASSNTIDRFPFSADSNATDVGDLTVARPAGAGQSSTTHGYMTGGYYPGRLNIIDKFLFTSSANATDVGDLTAGRSDPSGQQV